MGELEIYYREIACNSSTWANPDEAVCGCHGSGWRLSQVDTWHKCPFHEGTHPDDEDLGEPDYAFAAAEAICTFFSRIAADDLPF